MTTSRRYLLPCLMAALALLQGCATLVDTDAARLCRTLIPIIDRNGSHIDVVETIETRAAPQAGFVVAIDYINSDATRSIQRLACSFTRRDWIGPAAGIEALDRVSTVAGDIGAIRLRLLKRFWLESGEAAATDPAPFATLGAVPEVPRTLAYAVQVLVASAPTVSIYALLAAAYAMIYGLLGRINLAFGELTMISGYAAFLGYALATNTTTALALAAIAGLFAAIVHGGALGHLVLRPLARAPGQQMLIATLGLSIVWSELVRLTQGNGNRWMPPLLNRPLALVRNGDMIVTLTPVAVVVTATAAVACALLLLALKWSRFGRQWRAASDDTVAAGLCGIDTARILRATSIATALLAGLAGLLTMVYYGGVGFSGGLTTALKALVAAILGGIASPGTALLGGITVGLFEAAWSAVFPIEYRDPAIFLALALILALKPTGLYTRSQPGDVRR